MNVRSLQPQRPVSLGITKLVVQCSIIPSWYVYVGLLLAYWHARGFLLPFDIFMVGAIPGISATLIHWLSRPTWSDRGFLFWIIATSLVLPAIVALAGKTYRL